MKRILWIGLVTAMVGWTAPVSFTDRTSWQAAVGGSVLTDDLRGIAGTGDANVVSSLTRGGVTFTPGGNTQLVVADQDAPGYDFGAPGSVSFQLGFPSMLTLTFANMVFGFGFDVAAFPSGSAAVDLIAVVRTDAGLFRFELPAANFAGFTSDRGIRSIVLQSDFGDPALTNLSTAVPEPGTVMLVGVAMGWLVLRRRFPK